MVDDRRARVQADEERLERAAEPHDWGEELVDDVVEGLASPLTHDKPSEGAAIDPENRAEGEATDQHEVDERMNDIR